MFIDFVTQKTDPFIEEVSAVLDKKTLLQLYNTATSEPHSFLYVKLTASNKNDMFYINLNKKISYWRLIIIY